MNVRWRTSASFFIVCVAMLIALPAAASAGIWHTHADGLQGKCSACHFGQVATAELAIHLQAQPLVVASRSIGPTLLGSPASQSAETTSTRAPPSFSLL